MSDYKDKFTLRIDETVMNKIDVIADKNKRSINGHIEFILEKYIEEYEKDHGPIPYREEK